MEKQAIASEIGKKPVSRSGGLEANEKAFQATVAIVPNATNRLHEMTTGNL